MNKKNLLLLCFWMAFTTNCLAGEEAKIAPDTKITLERTACFGLCPIYKLSIYADGKVEFDGERYVGAVGHRVKTISLKNVTTIISEIHKINFLNLNGDYACFDSTDNPSVIITVSYEGKTKRIVHYHGCESAGKALIDLTKLEEKIDELAEIGDWLKYEDVTAELYPYKVRIATDSQITGEALEYYLTADKVIVLGKLKREDVPKKLFSHKLTDDEKKKLDGFLTPFPLSELEDSYFPKFPIMDGYAFAFTFLSEGNNAREIRLANTFQKDLHQLVVEVNAFLPDTLKLFVDWQERT